MNLTKCMRYWDDYSVTQLLVRRMGHLEKDRLAELVCWLTISKSEVCAKHVRVYPGIPVLGAIGCLEK